MADKGTFNIAIIGCGVAAELHAKALETVDGARLTGAYAADAAQCGEFCSRYGLRKYQSIEELLADGDVDIVDISTPSGTHRELAERSLRAGKHTVVEKPLGMTREQCLELIRVRDESGKMLAPISQLRFSEDMRLVRAAIEGGKLGKVTMCSVYMKYFRERKYYEGSSWRGSRDMDGGALMNQGIHGIDLLRFVAGNARVLSAKIKTLGHNIEAEDTAVAILEFESGAIGVIEGCTTAKPGYPRRIELCGMGGSLIIEEDGLKVCNVDGLIVGASQKTASGSHNDPAAASTYGHTLQFRDIVRHLTTGEPLFYPAEEAAKTVGLICDIYAAGSEA